MRVPIAFFPRCIFNLTAYVPLFILFTLVAFTAAEPSDDFDPLNLHEDERDHTSTVGSVNASDPHRHGYAEIRIFKIQWDHVSAPLTIALWFFAITIAKLAFHGFERMHKLLPDSALLIVLGLFFGYILHLIYPDEVYLKPDWFFLYLLPPIALDAGYFLPNKDFFRNFGTIMTYAVFGTLYNAFSIGATLYIFSDIFKFNASLIQIMLFSTLISAVDPVAVLCVFEEIHVNQLLYICVFGESLLNDAVTIVLYQAFSVMAGADKLLPVDYVKTGASFFVVSLGGILIGMVWAFVTGFTTKHAKHLNVVQPLICLLFPYLAYLTAELVAMSGILAIVMCGLTMKQFLMGNLSRKSLVTVQYFMKTLSSSCEALIFVYLGISAVSKNHDWNVAFVIITLVSCLVQRFVGVFLLTWLLNRQRVQKIDMVDQFIMSYGGIRGAVCYGLVMSLDADAIPAKNMFASCTVVIILFTVFVQGATIKKLVKLLKVKTNVVHKKTIFEMVGENVINHTMAAVEATVGHRGHYWFRQTFNHCIDLYVKPYLMDEAKSEASRLLDYHEHIQVKEAVQHLKQHGSFAGLPNVGSKANIENVASGVVPIVIDDSTYTSDGFVGDESGLLTARSRGTRRSIPRNESLSAFVRNKLNSFNSPLNYGMYSRHLLGVDNLPHFVSRRDYISANSFDALDKDSYAMTYPYCKNTPLMSTTRRSCRVKRPNEEDYCAGDDSPTPARKAATSAASSTRRPRFLITSDPNDFRRTPPNAPRQPRRKSTEQELEEGFALKSYQQGAEGTCDGEQQRKGQSNRSREGSSAADLEERHNLLPVVEADESSENMTGRNSTAESD